MISWLRKLFAKRERHPDLTPVAEFREVERMQAEVRLRVQVAKQLRTIGGGAI